MGGGDTVGSTLDAPLAFDYTTRIVLCDDGMPCTSRAATVRHPVASGSAGSGEGGEGKVDHLNWKWGLRKRTGQALDAAGALACVCMIRNAPAHALGMAGEHMRHLATLAMRGYASSGDHDASTAKLHCEVFTVNC